MEASDVSWTRVTCMVLEIITRTSMWLMIAISLLANLTGRTTLGCIILALTEVQKDGGRAQ